MEKTESNNLEQKKKTAIDILKKSFGNVSKTCETLGINRTTFYQWKKDDPSFKEAVDNIGEFLLDFAESSLYALIKKKNIAATIFYLKTKGKARGYVERTEIEEVQKPEFKMYDASGKNPIENQE